MPWQPGMRRVYVWSMRPSEYRYNDAKPVRITRTWRPGIDRVWVERVTYSDMYEIENVYAVDHYDPETEEIYVENYEDLPYDLQSIEPYYEQPSLGRTLGNLLPIGLTFIIIGIVSIICLAILFVVLT